MRILIIVTNTAKYAEGDLATGVWLSELTHIYHSAKEQGHIVTIASPKGGNTPIDPESLKPLVMDKISKNLWTDKTFREMLQNTRSLSAIFSQQFDCVYLAGGHGTMYDFPNDIFLQAIIRKQYEYNKMVAAICHGVGGLLNVKLVNGDYLIEGKQLTGFDWFEESIAGRKTKVPFNLEAALNERKAVYKKAFIPMTSNVVMDGNLITGQNPFSSKELAKVVMEQLRK